MNGNIEDHGNYKHGLMEHPLYGVWSSMKSRCNPSETRNESWYGRGIIFCNEWKEFIPFYKWAINNGYQKGLTLDRIDNDGDYKPANCRFTTYSEQNSNKRKYQSMPRH
jgi:hypothetical protein